MSAVKVRLFILWVQNVNIPVVFVSGKRLYV
jgi:hypothetical protein